MKVDQWWAYGSGFCMRETSPLYMRSRPGMATLKPQSMDTLIMFHNMSSFNCGCLLIMINSHSFTLLSPNTFIREDYQGSEGGEGGVAKDVRGQNGELTGGLRKEVMGQESSGESLVSVQVCSTMSTCSQVSLLFNHQP